MADIIPFAPTLVRQMAAASNEGAHLVARPAAALVSVRARGDAVARVSHTLGVSALPPPNATVGTRLGDCLWLRPDEWLIVGAPASRQSLIHALEAAVGAEDGAVVDVSASRIPMELSGPRSRDILASCCPLDLHPRFFAVGACAQSVVAKAPVLLHLVDDSPRWRIYVRPSLAAYVVAWLTDAMCTFTAADGGNSDTGRAILSGGRRTL